MVVCWKDYIGSLDDHPNVDKLSIRMVDDNYQDIINGKVIDTDNFYKEFKPSSVYSISDVDREYVMLKEVNHIWSLYDLDNLLLLTNGYHRHSKVIGYVITDKPWVIAATI